MKKFTENQTNREETKRSERRRRTHWRRAALVALLLTGCETRIDNPHAVSTAALTARKAELQEKERDDAYGIYFGPTRWISHAIDEKKSRDELRSIDAQLAQR